MYKIAKPRPSIQSNRCYFMHMLFLRMIRRSIWLGTKQRYVMCMYVCTYALLMLSWSVNTEKDKTGQKHGTNLCK